MPRKGVLLQQTHGIQGLSQAPSAGLISGPVSATIGPHTGTGNHMEIVADWRIDELSAQQVNLLVLAMAIAGVLYCFMGYRTLRFLIGLTGFLFAGVTAAALAGMVWDGRVVPMVIAGLFGGVCGAFALTFLYKTGIFLIGAFAGMLAAHNLLAASPDLWVPFAVIFGGLAAGTLALFIERPVMVIATALLGAWMLVSSLAYFFFEADWLQDSANFLADHEERPLFILLWAVLSVAGVAAQFATSKKKEANKD